MKANQIPIKSRLTPASTRSSNEAIDLDYKISKTAIGVIAILSALIGIWGFLCLATGCIMSGNLLELGSEWFSAVTGL